LTNPFTRFGLLLLLALSLAFSIGLFVYQQEQKLALGIWPDSSLDGVQSIEVTTRKERYALVREPSGWVVRLDGSEADVPPIPADASRVEALLADVAHNRPSQTLEPSPGLDAAALGFDSPFVRLVITPSNPDNRPAQITLGHETPTGAALYAHSSLAPDSVFLLDASVLHHLDKPAEYFFDTRLLDVRGEDVQRLSLSGPLALQWDLERKDDQFSFLTPASMQGTTLTSSEVRLYIHNLTAISADVIFTKPDRQVVGKAACSIDMLVGKSATPHKLELFAPLDGDQVFGRSTLHPSGFLVDREKARSLVRQEIRMDAT